MAAPPAEKRAERRRRNYAGGVHATSPAAIGVLDEGTSPQPTLRSPAVLSSTVRRVVVDIPSALAYSLGEERQTLPADRHVAGELSPVHAPELDADQDRDLESRPDGDTGIAALDAAKRG